MTKSIPILSATLLLLCSAHAAEPVESDFFTDTIGSVDQTVNLVTDYLADGTDTLDDSTELQTAIDDMTTWTNGGKIIIPAGTFYLDKIQMKSNVHLVIDAGATIISYAKNATFLFGVKANTAERLIPVENASIRGSGGSFTVDISGRGKLQNKNVVGCQNANNFMVADIHVIDDLTDISSVTVNSSEYNGTYTMSSNGVIKNISGTGLAYGYGTMQMKAGYHILFKNLSGDGGVTLRLESGGGIYTAPSYIFMDQIYARDIVCTNGQAAFTMSPHTRDNGYVNIARATAYSCGFSGNIAGGFVAGDETNLVAGTGLLPTPGTFSGVHISDVHAVYGTTAMFKWKHFRYIPCAIRGLLSTTLNPDGESYNGPSAASVLYDADPNDTAGNVPGDYAVTLLNVTDEGFLHQFKTILNEDDAVSSCNAVPVNGLALDQTSLSLAIQQTAILTEMVFPVDATDPSVSWSSSAPSIATVSAAGLVTGLAPGLATVSATTTDGGYTASCLVTVAGGGTGGTFTLNPVADAQVRSGTKADTNYGSASTMETKGTVGNFTREAYARFDVSSLPGGTVTAATLRLKVAAEKDPAQDTHTAYAVSNDSWSESAITWNTKPAAGAALDSAVRPAVGAWIELDVTAQVNTERNSDGSFSVVLQSGGDAVIDWYTKEAAAGDQPELVVTTGSANQAPTFNSNPVNEISATENTAYTATLADNASDPDNDPLNFSRIAGPSWLNIANDGSLSGTPSNADVGQNSWTVQVSDGAASDTATLKITVDPAPTGWTLINSENFESGWGIWNDNGSDCRRNINDAAHAHSGSYCVRIRDNTSTSRTTSNTINLSAYTTLKIDVWFDSQSMAAGDRFDVKVRDTSGTYQTVASLVSGTDFTDGQMTFKSIEVSTAQVNFGSNCRVRFECEAPANSDKVFLDDLELSAK